MRAMVSYATTWAMIFLLFFSPLRTPVYLFFAILSTGTRRPYASITFHQIHGEEEIHTRWTSWKKMKLTFEVVNDARIGVSCSQWCANDYCEHFTFRIFSRRGPRRQTIPQLPRILDANQKWQQSKRQSFHTQRAYAVRNSSTQKWHSSVFGPMCVLSSNREFEWVNWVPGLSFAHAFSKRQKKKGKILKATATHPSSRIDVIS